MVGNLGKSVLAALALSLGITVAAGAADVQGGTSTPPSAASAQGASDADLAARLNAIESLVQKQQDTITVQQRQIEELKSQGEKSTDSVGAIEAKLAKADKEKKLEVPGWLDGLKFSGDLRLRYEGVWADPRKAGVDDAQHLRFRLRFGFEKKVTDDFDLGFRLASGSDNNAASTNQTLTTDFTKKPIWIDLAYLTWHPKDIPGLVVGGGKFKNPYGNTDMVWDSDVNPEGLYESYKIKINDSIEPFITLGQNVLNENTAATGDAWLMAIQPGANISFSKDVVWTSALAYYDYLNYAKKGNFTNARGNTAGPNGTLAAGEFSVINFTNIVKVNVAGVSVYPYFDYAENTGDQALVATTKQDQAWATGVRVGDVKNQGDWAVDYKYARIEADSVAGAFADSDFGYANTKGHKVGVAYGVAKNTTVALSYFHTKPVTGATATTDTLMADLVFKF